MSHATRLAGDVEVATVAPALATGDPLPGTTGFAGVVAGDDRPAVLPTDLIDGDAPPEAVLVRDVLGRQPVWYDALEVGDWSFDPEDLTDPTLLPAGHALSLDAADPAPIELWSLPDPDPEPAESATDAVADAVRAAVDEVDAHGLAVAFSGGVDSAVVAAGVPDAPLYAAGFEGSHDVEAARVAAEAMDRELRVVAVDHDDLRRVVPEVVAATGRTNPMDVQIAVPLFLVAEAVAGDGYDRLAVGQGADELFGGYAKVVDPADDPRVRAETVREARRETMVGLPDQLARDVRTLRAAGVEPVAPLLDDRVVDAALRLPGEAIAVAGGDGDAGAAEADGADPGASRKIALRAAAEGLVPETVRTAEKTAVQYGTDVARELDRLARRAGYKRRMDDHLGRYVRALATDSVGEEFPTDDHGESG